MKIYFAGSIRGGRLLVENYRQFISFLKKEHEIMSEHVASPAISKSGETKALDFIYERDIAWLDDADVVVADVTLPSLGVGFEIGYAQAHNTPIIALYYVNADASMSAMINGNSNITKIHYSTVEDAEEQLTRALEKLK
jgi:2'-deoxynucleoside 5'-phosphate N-hydrolase